MYSPAARVPDTKQRVVYEQRPWRLSEPVNTSDHATKACRVRAETVGNQASRDEKETLPEQRAVMQKRPNIPSVPNNVRQSNRTSAHQQRASQVGTATETAQRATLMKQPKPNSEPPDCRDQYVKASHKKAVPIISKRA